MSENNAKRCVSLWLVLTVMLFVMSCGICSCKQTVIYEPADTIVVLRKHDPAPFHGILLDTEQWMDIYQRLAECENE